MTLYVVPGERHVERLARNGVSAETRTALRTRLASELLPDVRFADARETRLTLAMALWARRDGGAAPPQLDLFGAASGAAAADPSFAPLLRRGGASWVRYVASIDAAIRLVRARGATAEHLERVADATSGVTRARARTLALAMRALDDALAAAGATDARSIGPMLADAIRKRSPADLAAHVGERTVRARWLLVWEPAELRWWRALDEGLAGVNGWARIVVPSFDRPLEGERERDPLECIAEDLAQALDAAPEHEPIAMVLGDLTGRPPEQLTRVTVLAAQDPVAQAHLVAGVVRAALREGAAVERVAIVTPSLDERSLAPLRRALEEVGVVAHEARGAPPSGAAVVVASLLALEVAESLDRRLLAQLLRSGFVDAGGLARPSGRPATYGALVAIARALETSRLAAGAEPAARILATVAAQATDRGTHAVDRRGREELTRALVEAFGVAGRARTRGEHVAAARTLWTTLGMGARAGRGGLSTFASDEAPRGVPRAERLAIARDARAWDSLRAAVDAYESAAHASGALGQEIEAAMFRLELAELLDASSSSPGASRTGAIRIARLGDVVGEELDLLVVIDANEGLLPRDVMQDPILSDALAAALAKSSRGAFRAIDPAVMRARELAALAASASEADRIVISQLAEDGAGALLAPSPVGSLLIRAGATPLRAIAEASRRTPDPMPDDDVLRRAAREETREAFFLDPARPTSDLTADLRGARADVRAVVRSLLEHETGQGERALAVTSLERFARCPFMGLAHVVFAAREAERQEDLPDAREEGTLVHEALAAAFVATAELWPLRPRDAAAILERGMGAVDDVLARATGHAVLAAVVRLRVRDSARAVLSSAIEDEDWDFAYAEQAFGGRRDGGEGWPALDVAAEGERLRLRGTIDRIDRRSDGGAVRVVDYKRSKGTVRDAGSGLGITAFQVPLYACVAERQLGVPAAGRYVPYQARDLAAGGGAPSAKVSARMEELVVREARGALTEIERRSLSVIRAVRDGRLAPVPAEEATCRTCAVSGGCRKPRFAMAPDDEDEEGAP